MAVWRAYLVAGMLTVSTYVLVPRGLVSDAVFLVVGLSAVVAICWGVRQNGPATRAPWHLFVAGLLSWVVADTIYSWNEDVRGVVPFPSISDVAYLGAYPVLAAGIFVLIRRRGARLDVPGALDSAIVVAGLGLISWAWIAGPIVAASDVPVLERAVAVAYPISDILLLTMLARLVAASPASSAAFRLLVGAVSVQIIADTAWAAAPSTSWDYSTALDLLWLASYVLWGASALHPQMGSLAEPAAAGPVGFTRRRMAALSSAALLPPATFLVAMATGRTIDAPVVVVGAIILTSLVLARMAYAIREVRLTARQRDDLQDELFHQAAHDPLTGMFSRAYMLRLIDGALSRGRCAERSTGLVLVDLDRFTTINDEWGPATGDEVLRETARRIRTAAGAHHPVARLGDDQFVVLVETIDAVDETPVVAHEILGALAAPHVVSGSTITTACSIGLSVSLDIGTDADGLLHQAMIASHRAKASGAGAIEVFDHHMRREIAQRAEVEAGLRVAMDEGDLELHYQSVISVRTGDIIGYEALVRWRRPEGLVMPAAFIPIAERSDLICEIGRWVLHEATRQLESWTTADPDAFGHATVAVNISGRHLADHTIVDDVAHVLDRSGLDASRLVVEVTETVMVDVPHAAVQLGALRDLGVSVSLDDFGTGFTSIGQLRELPIDTLKIDKSFLASTDPGWSELVALITAAAHACGTQVVAEGVERQDQHDVLAGLGCDLAQGYLFAPPLPAGEVLRQAPDRIGDPLSP
ncbi:putative bifunctional diguanylate cyclase/phosphodiesterase [Aeromicrobium stalagmiti]|uniref:putative bifunctional diguanylate cyclase/phosphodiesterase n=1 Tax=Aeromicrobium stalagmiti TaxID=2738988 RepID=UPI0015690602|nr:EAL domain-containing protein [Aeromicrobium stalagmiti]NRQ49633.1 EAL domain-containing protein [Aeromicrobium stalagmiti]